MNYEEKKQLEQYRKDISLMKENIEKIKKSPLTKKIVYEDCKEPFDYVSNLFPESNIKEVIIYETGRTVLRKLGYAGVGGFFEKILKNVIISREKLIDQSDNFFVVKAKVKTDEVICHELIHYCDDEHRLVFDPKRKEEFAYGWSLGYLRGKGYTDEYIARYNYLPFFYMNSCEEATKNVFMSEGIKKSEFNSFSERKRARLFKKMNRKIVTEAINIGMEKGLKLIKIYDKKINDGKVFIKQSKMTKSKFDLLDI